MAILLSDTARQLREQNRDYYGNKAWDTLYESISSQARQQERAIQQDTSEAVASAYASAAKQRSNVLSSDLLGSNKKEQLYDIDKTLDEAYDTYMSNQAMAISEIQTAEQKAKDEVSTALNEQAANYDKLVETLPTFLQYAWDKYKDSSIEENPFYSDPLLQRYSKLVPELDAEGNPVLDEDGNPKYTEERELDWEQVEGRMYDADGNLTTYGSDVIDQLFNIGTKYNDLSYYSWLKSNDNDLYSWATSYNPYDYTEAGTNLGSFNKMVNLSTDFKYDYIERFGGMSLDEVKSTFNELWDTSNKDFTSEDMQTNIKQLKSKLDAYGLGDTVNWDQVTNNAEKLYAQYTAANKKHKDAKTQAIISGSISAIAIIASIAATIGTAGAASGTLPLAVGAAGSGSKALAIGAITSGVTSLGSISDVRELRKQAEALKSQANQMYVNALAAMAGQLETQYAKSQK